MPEFWPWIVAYFILGFMAASAIDVLFETNEKTQALVFCGVFIFWPLFFWFVFLNYLKERRDKQKGE
jgi:hypothetical protein